jgi:hypothetical protein
MGAIWVTRGFGLRRMGLRRLGAVALVAFATSACATPAMPPPVVSKASLGSIIIYRNGVAFFERSLPPGEKELTLRVPAERVDDFLKSLTIVDKKTGETMPVSYPTIHNHGSDVEMTIALPEKHNGLTISYVTESPAWKPSYRLVLGKGGKARLQGWAVVDNVSGEDWKNVRIGVGSTSALSFRYDLHSVRMIERETLSSGSLLAVAPPTGGSPYATDGDGAPQVLANISQSATTEIEKEERRRADESKLAETRTKKPVSPGYAGPAGDAGGGHVVGGFTSGATGYGRGAGGIGKSAPARPLPQPAYQPNEPKPTSVYREWDSMVTGLGDRLRSTGERVRVEGFAQNGDDDPRSASLGRANALRDRLIEEGVSPAQIDAVGTGEVNEAEGLRVVTVVEDPNDGKTADAMPDGQPLGQAHFLSNEPMTIQRDHSAMVSILQAEAEAERVYFYDPISPRGSDSYAFNAVRLTNPSEYTLDSGPFTVYVEGQFLGEGLTEPILPRSTAFIPYALDRSIIVEPAVTGREEIDRLVTIQRGVVTAEARQVRTTKLVIVNRGDARAPVYVRHKVQPGYELSTRGPKVETPEKLDGAHLFRIEAPAGQSVELVIEEHTPIRKTVDISSTQGVEAMALYLKGAKLPEHLRQKLADIVERHQERMDLEEKIRTLDEQMVVYRTRVDELNIQLITLKKLPQGTKLRRHLSDKLEEISGKLQDGTMRLADMKAELMTRRIELSDRLAELSLEQKNETELASKE